MAEVKDKVITVESLKAKHDYDESTYLKKSGALGTLGITATATELNKLDGVTATTAELNYVDGVTSSIQTQLNAKQATLTGAATTIASSNLTASRALVSNSSGKVAVSDVTSTELGYLDGVTSNVQTQINNHNKHYPTPVTVAGEDLNNYTDAGLYTFSSSYTPVNVPTNNVNGWLLVIPWVKNNTTVKQLWFRHGSLNSNDFDTYVRTKVGDTWSNWSRYYTSNGGTITGNVVLDNADIYSGNMYINENGANTGMIYAKSPSGSYMANIKPCNENGNCVIGYDNYDKNAGDTNIYGKNIHIYALNSDGTTPEGSVFVGRNDSNHTLINHEAHLEPSKISDTYIYGRAVHIDTNDTNFIVDSIQLAHTDKYTVSTISSGWSAYGSGDTPTFRRYGKVVSLTGALKNDSSITLNTTHVKVFSVPSGYRPSHDIIAVCQGSGSNKFLIQIQTDGTVSFGRYGTTSFVEAGAGSWFPFHVTWVME